MSGNGAGPAALRVSTASNLDQLPLCRVRHRPLPAPLRAAAANSRASTDEHCGASHRGPIYVGPSGGHGTRRDLEPHRCQPDGARLPQSQQVGHPGRVHLAHDPAAVDLDRLLRRAERSGDLVVEHPFHHEGEHRALGVRQLRETTPHLRCRSVSTLASLAALGQRAPAHTSSSALLSKRALRKRACSSFIVVTSLVIATAVMKMMGIVRPLGPMAAWTSRRSGREPDVEDGGTRLLPKLSREEGLGRGERFRAEPYRAHEARDRSATASSSSTM